MVVRNLVSDDISTLLRLEKESYLPELLETKRGFLRKIEIFPQGCLCCEEEGQIHAFAISHPWHGEKEVEIDAYKQVIPDLPDCYYIHDLVVEHKYRGKGLAELLVKQLVEVSRGKGISKLVLVAVQNSEPFWARYGFQPVRKLNYGLNFPATYMCSVTT
jgi:N-acetylglutamate synthase-like GNAT family acetyltransferase